MFFRFKNLVDLETELYGFFNLVCAKISSYDLSKAAQQQSLTTQPSSHDPMYLNDGRTPPPPPPSETIINKTEFL